MNSKATVTLPGSPDPATLQGVGTLYGNWRQSFVRPMLVGALVLAPLALIPALLSNQGFVPNIVFIASYAMLALLALVPMPYPWRLGGFLALIYVVGLTELLVTGILGNAVFFFLGLTLFSTMMLSPRGGAIATGISLLTFAAVGWMLQTGRTHLLNIEAMSAKPLDWMTAAATTLLFNTVIILGFRQLELGFASAQRRVAQVVNELEMERGSQEERVAGRTVQLRAISEVGRAASAILDPDELITRVVNLISDRLGYYYAALFLVNETGDQADLHSATGEAGRLLMENKHHLRVGGNSMVGMAISTAQPRIALDTDERAVRFENPLLPYTRSEIALPLIVGGRVLGALDVQSTKAGAFGPNEIDTLQGMATQVAIAYENARLFQDARRNLQDLQAIQRQYVLESWKPMNVSGDLQYEVGDEDLPADSRRLEVPLALRDEIIGMIDLAGEQDWTADQRNFIEAVATQAALALENVRLVEATQSAAIHEHLLAEITSKVWAATTIDGILRTAVGELGHALNADEATIELRADDGRG